MSDRYILDEQGQPVECPDLMTWARWFEAGEHRRRIALDKRGDITVSTVFLGLDHSFFGGPPVLWETMIFGGEHDEDQERYTSQADALAGHARMCELAFGAPITPPLTLSPHPTDATVRTSAHKRGRLVPHLSGEPRACPPRHHGPR
jgi:hypothetical protein